MIQLYKNMLDDDLIKELLDYYQHNLDRLTDYGNFEQVEVDAGHKLSNLMKDLTHKIGDDYFERHDKTGMAPKTYAVEGFRIKRYEPNQGSFPWHVDAGTIQNCTRFLAFLYYLNDNDAGTKFEKVYVPAEKGSVVVFPPMWMYPHEGEMPKEKPKFIMSTYFHFIGVDSRVQS